MGLATAHLSFGMFKSRGVALGLALMLTTAVLTLAPASANAENVRDTLAQAYRYNPRLDAERARLRATDEDVDQATAGFRPRLTFQGDVGHQDNETTFKQGAGNFNNSSGQSDPRGYSFQATQSLFKGFQTLNAVNEAEAAVRAGRETLRNVEQEVLLAAVESYGNVVRDTAIVRLRENNVNVLQSELKATQDRFAVGEVTRTDIAQAQARRAAAVSELDLARATLKSSRATYEQTVGSPPSNLAEPKPETKIVPHSLNEAIGISAKENPNVVAALYREQAARFTVDRIRGELLPEAQLEATYSDRYNSSTQVDRTESGQVVARFSMPIYEGGEIYSRVRQAKHTQVSRIQEIEQQRAQAQQIVVQAWSQLQAAKAQLISDKAQIEANTTALQGTREEEKVGQRTLLDVLNAQQELLISQVQVESTKRNILFFSYSVVSGIGRLNVQEVGAVSTVYDPVVHHDEVARKWWGLDITRDDGTTEHVDAWQGRVEHEPVK